MPRLNLNRERSYLRLEFVAACLLFTTVTMVSGQQTREETPPLRERLFYGGGLGLQFGTITNIQITPIVGLWVRPRLAIGLGPHYTYYKNSYFTPTYSTTIYGGNGYIQYYPIKDLDNLIPVGIHMGIFLHLEDELLSLESSFWDVNYNPNTSRSRFMSNAVLGGFGISQMMGQRSSINLMFLWALNSTVPNLYSSPEIRISFNF